MKINLFMPEYMKKFKCIASECNDTCCAGWDINIDGNTLEKYNNSTGKLKEIVDKKYISNKNQEEFFNSGLMILKEEKRCPFLNEDMLCDIHGNVGEEHLCITCKRYPRVYNIVDDIYEKSGLPSCEEVCNLAFLNKDKMEFIECEDEINEEDLEIRRIIDTAAFEGTDSLLQYFWDLRIMTINILQERRFSIEERINILENISEQIDKYFSSKDYDAIEDLIEELEEKEFEKYLVVKPKGTQKLYKELMSDQLIANIKSFRLKEVIDEYKNYLADDKCYTKFLSSKEEMLDKLSIYSYIFENYLVNQVFKDLVPFNQESLVASVYKLKISYLIIRSYSLGIMYGKQENFRDKDIIKIIQSFSKDAEHNKVFNYLFKG